MSAVPAGRRASTAADVAPPAPCADDGSSGRRILVMYGYPKGTTNQADTMRPLIRDAVALADLNLDLATPDVAGQHYRFSCKNDAVVSVRAVKLLPIRRDAAYTFNDVVASLADQVSRGLGSADFHGARFVYAVFVDNIGCCYAWAGQGSLMADDQPDPTLNGNNQLWPGSARYSMIRLGYDTATEARIFQHEVGHNLGAVQDTSQHSSGAYHCYDGNDVMCYADGGPYFKAGGAMTYDCPYQSDGLAVFDCGGDDYYNPTPAAGSYLESHWNLANSGWLTWESA